PGYQHHCAANASGQPTIIFCRHGLVGVRHARVVVWGARVLAPELEKVLIAADDHGDPVSSGVRPGFERKQELAALRDIYQRARIQQRGRVRHGRWGEYREWVGRGRRGRNRNAVRWRLWRWVDYRQRAF